MAANYSFRTSLTGFNREDVVRHLEYITNRHNNQVNQLKSEAESKERELQRLRQLETLPEQLRQLQEQYDALAQDYQAQQLRCAMLETQLEEEQARQVAIVSRTEEELEAYRRAERLERQAQQRAEQLRERANSIATEAGLQVDETARRIDQLSQQVAQQLQQLQGQILSSKDVLTEAAVALSGLRTETCDVC